MTLADTVKADLTGAMRAGDRDRVGRLRLLLSELQKAEKDGSSDEIAVLRRERQRRIAAAEQFREAGRSELAAGEEEAELIAAYLPAELSDEELRRLVEDAVATSGASSPKDMGAVMKAVMPAVGGRADGKRVSAQVREVLAS